MNNLPKFVMQLCPGRNLTHDLLIASLTPCHCATFSVSLCVTATDSGHLLSSPGSVVELLEAEYQLFKMAVYGGMSGPSSSRQHVLDEFISLQQRHATLVANLLRSHANLQQVNCT